MKRNNDKNDLFFKNIASAYAEKIGDELKKELDSLDNSANSLSLDTKLNTRLKKNRIKKWSAWMLPVSACFIIFIVYFAIRSPKYDMNTLENPSAVLNYEFVAAKLPENYTLVKVDYDNQKAIYYISTNRENEVILTVEESGEDIQAEGLNKIQIKDIDAYALVKQEYSLLKYKKNNILYTLTSEFDLEDLIRISEKLI